MNTGYGQIDPEQAKAETQRHSQAFERLTELLIGQNRRINLTRITEPQQIYERHFVDSLIALPALDGMARGKTAFCIADIGSGAGFPCLPLAIARPAWRVVSIEATGKKAAFQQLAADTLGLKNFQVVAGRAEELAHQRQYRETFDAVCARAVARLRILTEIAVGLVRVGGALVAWQGPDAADTLKENRETMIKMRAFPEEVLSYTLKEGQRFLLVRIAKTAAVDERLPRRYSAMLKGVF